MPKSTLCYTWYYLEYEALLTAIQSKLFEMPVGQHSIYNVSYKKKGNPGWTPNFSKSEKDLTKLISVHGSMIILLSLVFICIWPWMAAQQSIL